MIVPGTKLLWIVSLLVLPTLLLATLLPDTARLAWILLPALATLVIADATLALDRFRGVLPQRHSLVRLSKDHLGSVPIRIANPHPAPVRLRLGLAWPAPFESPEPLLDILLPPSSPANRFHFQCIPRERGSFLLENLYAARLSPLGFWETRARLPLDLELRVFPDLHHDRAAAAIFLRRGLLGIHHQRQVGKGREFEKLRDYLPGDSYEDIHWKTTAKRHRPVTKVFQIERTQEIYCIIDASRLSARRVGPSDPSADATPPPAPEVREATAPRIPTLLERYVAATMLFATAAARQGDLFGLVTFAGRVIHAIPAKNGRAHHDACRDAIYSIRPREVSPDFQELFAFLRTNLRKRALLLFLTSLDDPLAAETFTRHLPLLRRTHLIQICMIDPRDTSPLFTRPVQSLPELYDALAAHHRWENLQSVERTLALHGVRLAVTSSEQLVVSMLNQYMEIKRRQLL